MNRPTMEGYIDGITVTEYDDKEPEYQITLTNGVVLPIPITTLYNSKKMLALIVDKTAFVPDQPRKKEWIEVLKILLMSAERKTGFEDASPVNVARMALKELCEDTKDLEPTQLPATINGVLCFTLKSFREIISKYNIGRNTLMSALRKLNAYPARLPFGGQRIRTWQIKVDDLF